MMYEPTHWVLFGVSPQVFESAGCREAELPAEDAATVGVFLQKVHQGKGLGPSSQCRDFELAIHF